MSYSDIINVVSISVSRIFADKKEGQKVHDSINNANNNFTNNKALCGDSEKPNETEQSVEVSYKQLRAKTEIEKSEMFKTLLQDTMKDHLCENLELNEHFEKVKNATKMFLQYKNTKPTNYCIIKADDYEQILN